MGSKDRVTVFEGGTLIDGTGADPVEKAVLVVEGSRIAAVGGRGEVEVPRGARTIDVRGKAIIPGLIDAHLHLSGARPGETLHERWRAGEALAALRAAVDCRNMLMMGYTAVRDCGSSVGVALRRAVEEGTVAGPRIVTSGRAINNTYGHVGRDPPPVRLAEAMGSTFADGVPQCLEAVRTQLREGADFIKIASGLWGESRVFPRCMPSYSFEEVEAMCGEAHRARTIVASHCQGKEAIMSSLRAGVDTIEHGREFDEECARLTLEKGRIYSPTLAVVIVESGESKLHRSEEERELFNRWQYESIRIAHERGVKIASGSDFSGTGTAGSTRMPRNALDLERLVTAGLSPLEAIVSATKISAEALTMGDRIGTLERGKLADLVVVNGNPLEDISMIQDEGRIGLVMKGGEIAVKRF